MPYCKKRKHFSIIITNGMSTLLACWIYRSCSVTKLVKWWQICKMKLYQWLSDVQIWLEPLIGPFIKLAMGPFKKGTGKRKPYQNASSMKINANVNCATLHWTPNTFSLVHRKRLKNNVQSDPLDGQPSSNGNTLRNHLLWNDTSTVQHASEQTNWLQTIILD